jgi:hypothetical protein
MKKFLQIFFAGALLFVVSMYMTQLTPLRYHIACTGYLYEDDERPWRNLGQFSNKELPPKAKGENAILIFKISEYRLPYRLVHGVEGIGHIENVNGTKIEELERIQFSSQQIIFGAGGDYWPKEGRVPINDGRGWYTAPWYTGKQGVKFHGDCVRQLPIL